MGDSPEELVEQDKLPAADGEEHEDGEAGQLVDARSQ